MPQSDGSASVSLMEEMFHLQELQILDYIQILQFMISIFFDGCLIQILLKLRVTIQNEILYLNLDYQIH